MKPDLLKLKKGSAPVPNLFYVNFARRLLGFVHEASERKKQIILKMLIIWCVFFRGGGGWDENTDIQTSNRIMTSLLWIHAAISLTFAGQNVKMEANCLGKVTFVLEEIHVCDAEINALRKSWSGR